MKFKTEQEQFWSGEFGDQYIERNKSQELLASNLNFFSKALKGVTSFSSCIEFGANIGMNLKALKLLYPNVEFCGIEINSKAVQKLSEVISSSNIYNSSILDFAPSRQWDLVMIKGVLIHINPNYLEQVYANLVGSMRRYLVVAEYYNPVPVNVVYRGHSDRLFKRDFVGEILDRYSNLHLIDYGFAYHRDINFPQDDLTWFLMEKR